MPARPRTDEVRASEWNRPKGQDVSRAGFTLVELLVVTAIVALLASLLLPAISRAKAQATKIQCLNRLRQYGIYLGLYLGDYAAYPTSDNSSWVIDYPRPVRDRQFDLRNSGNSRFSDAMYAHRTGLNQVFSDGHVEFRKRQDFESDSDRNRRRWLADNRPHRELGTRKSALPP